MFSHLPFTILEGKPYYLYFRDGDDLVRWLEEEGEGSLLGNLPQIPLPRSYRVDLQQFQAHKPEFYVLHYNSLGVMDKDNTKNKESYIWHKCQ